MKVRVIGIDSIDESTVAISISLDTNPELRNTLQLRAAMDAYIARLPNLKGMAAGISGATLTIVARGSIDQDKLKEYMEKVND